MSIKLVPEDSGIYNASDATGHERGDMGKGKPKVKRIYSVHAVMDGMAICQSWDAWGQLCHDNLPINTLEPYSKP